MGLKLLLIYMHGFFHHSFFTIHSGHSCQQLFMLGYFKNIFKPYQQYHEKDQQN
jgi:hypothetical protein